MYPSSALPRWRSSVRSPRSKPVPKKWVPILALFTVGFLVWVFQNLSVSWKRQSYHGDLVNVANEDSMEATTFQKSSKGPPRYNKKEHQVAATKFKATPLKPVGEPYTKMLVIPRTLSEDISWVEENFGGDPHISYSIYTADDPTSPLHPPKNKGHEVMIYLSYIIENYNNLSDVNIFMHSHRNAWHNNEILENDAVLMIARLSSERVQREGYMNMRCQWEPGCPSWMHPGNLEEDMNKQEETLVGKSWSELFPFDPMPEVLAQPCCAQFALSRDRIQAIPISRYVFYRDWLLRTQLSDYISGRVWEYIWQFVFTGHNIVCPQEHLCLCDGFGVCFGGQPEYENYLDISKAKKDLEDELDDWRKHKEQYTGLVEAGKFREAEALGTPAQDKDVELNGKMDELQRWLDNRKNEAMQHGDVAMNRAKEAGRRWADGDGF